MTDARYYLRVGDLLHNPFNGVFGLIVKTTKRYVYFYMIGESVEAAQYYYEEDDKVERASKSQIYFHIDKGELMIYYGSSRRRKRRPLSKLDNSFI